MATAPVVLLAGIAVHPFVADLRDKDAVAAVLTAGVTRWSIAHLLVAVAAPLVALALLAVAAMLRQRGEWRWSARSVPFVVVGSSLFALLPAMEITVLAAGLAGADPTAVLLELDAWFVPVLLSGSAVFAVGVACVARSVVSAAVLGRGPTILVVGALLVSAASRFLPVHPGPARRCRRARGGPLAARRPGGEPAPAARRHRDRVTGADRCARTADHVERGAAARVP